MAKPVTVAAAKATASPAQSSSPAWPWPSVSSSAQPVAANMVGMPTRKTNSAAAGLRVRPSSMAMKIAAAEREVPGNTPASTWASPTAITMVQVIDTESGRDSA